ncbi:agenet domain-containing protein [Striga hermonthica]|uniref:Agenet domain-containing protein n=1 Tax=Striga hermonthica TaxID=68872 RepID=A0A9N7MWB9_STRHE|nr:agenet domain-containing protein [Striga hermonthica]
MPVGDKKPVKVESKHKEIEHSYSPGDVVEVSSDEEGFEGAWFVAKIVKKLNDKYLIEYQTLKDDDGRTLLREEVDSLHIRPCPPDVEIVDRFEVGEEVDAFYNDGWWTGIISKLLIKEKYSVYFSASEELIKFNHTDLRVHQNWVNGKWETSKNRKS